GAVRASGDAAPAADSAESRAAVNGAPASATGAPAARPSPARRASRPGATGTLMLTVVSWQPLVSSPRTTASALLGSGAPVMMRTVCPGPSTGSAPLPAGTTPST